MNTFIACGIVSIPIYLFYNFLCFKKKSISIWIRDWSLTGKNFDVLDDRYYEFQYKSSIKSCIVLSIIIILGIIFKWEYLFFLIFLLSFHISVFITKHSALSKNYLFSLYS